MTATLHARPTAPGDGRPQDLVLARIHLRLGSLGLARAELEGMAGTGSLDDEGLVDLAEARWRTGDLSGAGEAASAALASGNEAVVAYVIAAEATAAVGRPAEARRLASRALELADLSVTDVFAGMPRASVWPTEPGEATSTEPLFATALTMPAPATNPVDAAGPEARGLWDDHADLGAPLPDAAAALAAGRAALDAGDHAAAAVQLGLALRSEPSLAPALLGVVRDADGPAFALLRGDAYRLLGHERDARLAFANAAASLRGTTTDREQPDEERS